VPTAHENDTASSFGFRVWGGRQGTTRSGCAMNHHSLGLGGVARLRSKVLTFQGLKVENLWFGVVGVRGDLGQRADAFFDHVRHWGLLSGTGVRATSERRGDNFKVFKYVCLEVKARLLLPESQEHNLALSV